MPLVISDLGLAVFLRKILDLDDAAPLDATVFLFKNDFTPARTSSIDDFVFATFDGSDGINYDPEKMLGVAQVGDRAETESEDAYFQWVSAGPTQTVFGYLVLDNPTSGWLWSERFSVPREMSSGAVLSLTLVLYQRNDPDPP